MTGTMSSPLPPVGGRRLDLLVGRIAVRDRAAFRCLYAFLALPVWFDATRALPNPTDARAVTRSTFVEVGHLARHHIDQSCVDTRIWIGAITARQVHDRRRCPCTLWWLRDDYDGHVHRELAALLSTGRPRSGVASPSGTIRFGQRRRTPVRLSVRRDRA
jgi:hypothetical protein